MDPRLIAEHLGDIRQNNGFSEAIDPRLADFGQQPCAGLRPGIIVMKRGTVIEANHIMDDELVWAAVGKPYTAYHDGRINYRRYENNPVFYDYAWHF